MKIQIETSAGSNVVRSYAQGRVTINETIYTRSLIVTPERITDWRPQGFADLGAADFEPILALQPEVVLLGTGARLRFPAPPVTRPLTIARVGFEVMDTGAACRTYNVLMAEGRRVAAALLMIEA